MKNIFAVVLILTSLLINPGLLLAQESNNTNTATSSADIDSYALFWPLVPGKTMGDSMYSLKLFKEWIGDFFSFGDVKKAEYYTIISEKRALEIQKLYLENKDYLNGKKTLEQNTIYQKKAFDLIKKAEKDQQKVDSAKGRFATSLENQQKLFKLVQSKIPDDEKGEFNKAMENIKLYVTLLP